LEGVSLVVDEDSVDYVGVKHLLEDVEERKTADGLRKPPNSIGNR
jgi:hypothetical protein